MSSTHLAARSWEALGVPPLSEELVQKIHDSLVAEKKEDKLVTLVESLRSSCEAFEYDMEWVESSPVGVTRILGEPDLPEGIAWPNCTEEFCTDRPLIFIAQINLSEVPPHIGLPKDGLLSFFIELECNGPAQVFYFDKNALQNLRRAKYPENYWNGWKNEYYPAADEEKDEIWSPSEEMVFKADIAKKFSYRLTTELCESLELDDDFLENVNNDRSGAESGGAVLQLLGYPFDNGMIESEAIQDGKTPLMLLQVSSIYSGDLAFNDCGNLHFVISHEDLHALDFSRVTFLITGC